MEAIKKRYEQLLQRNKYFYLTTDYTLEMFASDLGTNRSYTSKFINNEFGVTFPLFINDLRLSHFLKLKEENPKAKIKVLATMSGFKNMYTFRRVFKQKYGVTPSEYFANKY